MDPRRGSLGRAFPAPGCLVNFGGDSWSSSPGGRVEAGASGSRIRTKRRRSARTSGSSAAAGDHRRRPALRSQGRGPLLPHPRSHHGLAGARPPRSVTVAAGTCTDAGIWPPSRCFKARGRNVSLRSRASNTGSIAADGCLAPSSAPRRWLVIVRVGRPLRLRERVSFSSSSRSHRRLELRVSPRRQLRVVLDLDRRARRRCSRRPTAVGEVERPARRRDAAAVDQRRIAADADQAAPRPLADQRAELRRRNIYGRASPPEPAASLIIITFGP